MRPDSVVVVAPEGQLTLCVIQVVEDFFVQKFVPLAAVKVFDERVPLRLAGIDAVPLQGVFDRPFQERPTDELDPIITYSAAGPAVDPRQGAVLASWLLVADLLNAGQLWQISDIAMPGCWRNCWAGCAS